MSLRVTRQHNEILAAGVGELRVTRQHAEILAGGDGKVRVTQQYVEVLAQTWEIIEESLSSSLNLAQTAIRDPLDFNRNVSSTVNLSQSLQYGQTIFKSAANAMNLTSVVSRVQEANASNTMNLAQQIIKNHIIQDFFPLASVINFSQQVDWWVGLYQSVIHNLVLTQQLEWQGPHYFYINTYLTNLNQTADAYQGCPWLPVEFEDNLNLASVLNRTQTLDVNNAISMTHDMYRLHTPESILNLVQTVEGAKTKSVPITDLNLSQTVDFSGIFQRALEHTTVIGHALTYYVENPCTDKQYAPYVGENTISDAPTPPSINEPFVPNDPTTTRFKLVYPALAEPTETVELRAPELDNIDRVAFNRISRETRGGKLTVFADPTWPKVQTVIVTFIGLTKTEVDDLLSFFVSHIGEEIGMQDWEGREWVGIITTPNEAAVQDGKSCTGMGWTVTFEFEGVLIESYTPGDNLNLVDTLNVEMLYNRGVTHELDLIQTAVYIKV